MLFPKRISDYAIGFSEGRNHEIKRASIRCSCGSEYFKILYHGRLSKKLLSPNAIICNDDGSLVVSAVCTSCANSIVLFDSRIDGYSAQVVDECHYASQEALNEEYVCKKCKSQSMRIGVRVEYTGIDELENDACKEDCFSWIWIDVECGECKSKVNGLVDMETA